MYLRWIGIFSVVSHFWQYAILFETHIFSVTCIIKHHTSSSLNSHFDNKSPGQCLFRSQWYPWYDLSLVSCQSSYNLFAVLASHKLCYLLFLLHSFTVLKIPEKWAQNCHFFLVTGTELKISWILRNPTNGSFSNLPQRVVRLCFRAIAEYQHGLAYPDRPCATVTTNHLKKLNVYWFLWRVSRTNQYMDGCRHLTSHDAWHLTSHDTWHHMTPDIAWYLTPDITWHLTSVITWHLTPHGTWHPTPDITWHLTTWHLTSPDTWYHLTAPDITWHLTSHDIWHNLTPDITWHLTYDTWHHMTSDTTWHLTSPDIWHLTSHDIWHLTSHDTWHHMASDTWHHLTPDNI